MRPDAIRGMVLKLQGVLVSVGGPQTLRACTHLDVSRAQAERAAAVIGAVVPKLSAIGRG